MSWLRESAGAARLARGLGVLWAGAWLWGVAPATIAQGGGYTTADAIADPQALRVLAEQGDKRAAFLLGARFASGRGGVRDDSEAVRWFRLAAEGGLAEAQYNLGVMYASGRGVPRDPDAAASWYRRAAEQGLAEAQFNLGTVYGAGHGVPRDEAQAARWLEMAADKGLAEAQYNLAVLHEHGRGVRLDGQRALELYRRAAEQGFEPARERHAALAEKLSTAPPAAGPAAPPASATRPAPAAGELAGADWLASLDPARYTVQLASFNGREDAERFARSLPEGAAAGIYSSVKLGKRWFAVVRGSYAAASQARAAVQSLPEALRRTKPWVRRVGHIHAEMQ